MIASTEKLKFLDEVESVNAEAQRLQEKGVDIIIVLSHCGLDVDRVMAADCPLIDVIVGGHSHTLLYTGSVKYMPVKYKSHSHTNTYDRKLLYTELIQVAVRDISHV